MIEQFFETGRNWSYRGIYKKLNKRRVRQDLKKFFYSNIVEEWNKQVKTRWKKRALKHSKDSMIEKGGSEMGSYESKTPSPCCEQACYHTHIHMYTHLHMFSRKADRHANNKVNIKTLLWKEDRWYLLLLLKGGTDHWKNTTRN